MSHSVWKKPLPNPQAPAEGGKNDIRPISSKESVGNRSVLQIFRRSKQRNASLRETLELEVEDSDYDESVLEEPEGYDILKDPEFADLETKSEFEDETAEAEEEEDLLSQTRAEIYDVLDTSPEVVKVDAVDRKLARRGHIPKHPTGGWIWRKATFVSEGTPEGEEGYVWNFEYKIGNGKFEKLSVNVSKEPQRVAKAGTKSAQDFAHHTYEVGMKLDILDIFKTRDGKNLRKKWRSAEIIAASSDKYWIRIHYVGWKPVWDEWLHVYADGMRISEQSKHTRQQARRVERRHQNFKKILARKYNLQLVKMEADGNCLFRTVAHQIYGTPNKHGKVRQECCNYLLKNKERFESFVGNVLLHVKKMKRDREWGDDVEIKAMEELYDRRFVIFTVSGAGLDYKPLQTHYKGDLPGKIKGVEPIRMSYHGRCHYNSIIPLSAKLGRHKQYKVAKKRTTTFIADHRRRMHEKYAKEEKERDLAAKKEALLAKRKKEAEKSNEEKQEEDENEEEEVGEAEEESQSKLSRTSSIVVIVPSAKKPLQTSSSESVSKESESAKGE